MPETKSKTQDEILAQLLTPLTDEEAKDLKFVTREEIEAAIHKVDKALHASGNGATQCLWHPHHPRYL